jgi:hypothetical protein
MKIWYILSYLCAIKERAGMKIFDKEITSKNFGTFRKCNLIASGKAIRFIMAGGASYDVPLDYFLTWNTEPHYIYRRNKWVRWDRTKHKSRGAKATAIAKCRPILLKTAVRVYLNNNTSYDVPWDTVLMACEKGYEHFGGLTNESKRITKRFHGANKQ